MSENETQEDLTRYKIAFVLDGEVADVLHTDERLLAIFTSNPLIIDVTDVRATDTTPVMPGATYDENSKSFTNPEYDPPTQAQIEAAQRTMEQAKAAGLL